MKVLLVTPPFTQLNTPYPATMYLKGYLNSLKVSTRQVDLSLEVILAVFSRSGLASVFQEITDRDLELDEDCFRIYSLQHKYLMTIDPVITFIQGKNPSLAHTIAARDFLPEGRRFRNFDRSDYYFGTLGVADKAKHLATLFLEDIGDFIQKTVDPWFQFSKYAESLSQSLTNFQEMEEQLQSTETVVTKSMSRIIERELEMFSPDLICITVPFPGNLYAALKVGQQVKNSHPGIQIAMGGGYCNTELRSLQDHRVFQYVDFITLDDGEVPLRCLIEHLQGKRGITELKRTFTLKNGHTTWIDGADVEDCNLSQTGTPDYSDLKLGDYLSVLDLLNPMHRLWSDGRWNKLTLAHGCYWGKCTFCDISLDYISRYDPLTAGLICDRIEEIMEQTGHNGFHFVDEAAPPRLLRDLAIEIIRREIIIVWWTNIRFEKTFTGDLCRLLRKSGCVAVSGGLEVASDRLLKLMQKGVTVHQVSNVAKNFTDWNILVHAYLMYGFPTQTAQETVDALEVVRQLFECGYVSSAYWHRFTMTAHSPVGLDPAAYSVEAVGPDFEGFAHNDLQHADKYGADHPIYSEGLNKALYNYMHRRGFEFELQEWFDFQVPATTLDPDEILDATTNQHMADWSNHQMAMWIGGEPVSIQADGQDSSARLSIESNMGSEELIVPLEAQSWILDVFSEIIEHPMPCEKFKKSYQETVSPDFSLFITSPFYRSLREKGLILI